MRSSHGVSLAADAGPHPQAFDHSEWVRRGASIVL
jgi:hypothetical protein